MLHRFLSGDSLGPNSYGSTAAPEVVIRQVGESGVEVWDIKQGEVSDCLGSIPLLLRCFDPKKSIYLYEPGGSRSEPYFSGLLIPTVCTVSPDDTRYKKFLKSGAVKLNMPTWTLPELQAVRAFTAARSPDQMPFNQDEISERFRKFGGSFRRVYPQNLNSRNKEEMLFLEGSF